MRNGIGGVQVGQFTVPTKKNCLIIDKCFSCDQPRLIFTVIQCLYHITLWFVQCLFVLGGGLVLFACVISGFLDSIALCSPRCIGAISGGCIDIFVLVL
jgi:hypothetical protein